MRAQLETAVGMVLTLVIIAAVLTLAVWGFMQLARTTSDASYDRFFSSLDSAASDHRTFGSRRALRIAAPEPFCVFNTSSAASCIRDYSGYETCERMRGYWEAAGAEDGNVVMEDGRNERIEELEPRNGRYACFDAGSRIAFIEGRGSHVTVSPMRELQRITLTDADNEVEAAFFTSFAQGGSPEIFYVYNRTAPPSGTYSAPSITVAGVEFVPDVIITSDGIVTDVELNPSSSDLTIRIPQTQS